MWRSILPALALATAITGLPVAAQDLPLQMQWRRAPDISMRQLIDQGFEIKSAVSSTEAVAEARYDTVTYLLQRGAEVYRCVESGVLDNEGTLKSQLVYCTVLVAPYDAKAKAAG